MNDDVIKGTLRVGSTVEVKHDPKKDATEAIITKIQDCSQYTVGEFIESSPFFSMFKEFKSFASIHTVTKVL